MALTAEQQALVAEWNAAKEQADNIAKPLTEREMVLRRMVVASLFPSPVEGAKNKESLPEGWSIKLTYSIDRKIDIAALPSISEQLRAMEVNPDKLVRYKPELETKEYKSLPENVRKVFDQALIIKPSTPQLELLSPGKK